ncbi:MAG: LON peptidase substrate-binding domain-containing protein [Planctomycetes bacterium]|nr:LON peptidase substrate-binding domain-containing protein [Planctomycetota bacterium]
MSEPMPLAGFNGRARLFPLPNLVFFPHVMQPLHIFEPRYRQMIADALAGDRMIALVLPRPGWEKDYAERPAIHSVACVGRIMAEQRLDDGRFNILLRGVARIRIEEEIQTGHLYRLAHGSMLYDTPICDEAHAGVWRDRVFDKLPGWFPKQPEVVEQIGKLLQSDLALGAVCDIIAFALPLDAEFKQQLLEELQVERRLRQLHDFLEASKSILAARKFPPEFSLN